MPCSGSYSTSSFGRHRARVKRREPAFPALFVGEDLLALFFAQAPKHTEHILVFVSAMVAAPKVVSGFGDVDALVEERLRMPAGEEKYEY
jgi:hypothetical protein